HIEGWCLLDLPAPLPYGPHVLKVLVELVCDHAQYIWKLTAADFIFEIRDDDATKVAAHDTDCLAPIRRSNAGWSSLIIMRPAKARSMRSENDCLGHLGSRNASGSHANCTKYPSMPSSPRLVAWVHRVFACSQPAMLSWFHLLSRFRVGMRQRKNTSSGLVASAKRNRKTFPLGRKRIAKSSSIRCKLSRLAPLIGTMTKHSSGDQ